LSYKGVIILRKVLLSLFRKRHSFLRIIMFYILLFLYMTKGALVFVLPE
jgi:hypothetical protein